MPAPVDHGDRDRPLLTIWRALSSDQGYTFTSASAGRIVQVRIVRARQGRIARVRLTTETSEAGRGMRGRDQRHGDRRDPPPGIGPTLPRLAPRPLQRTGDPTKHSHSERGPAIAARKPESHTCHEADRGLDMDVTRKGRRRIGIESGETKQLPIPHAEVCHWSRDTAHRRAGSLRAALVDAPLCGLVAERRAATRVVVPVRPRITFSAAVAEAEQLEGMGDLAKADGLLRPPQPTPRLGPPRSPAPCHRTGRRDSGGGLHLGEASSGFHRRHHEGCRRRRTGPSSEAGCRRWRSPLRSPRGARYADKTIMELRRG